MLTLIEQWALDEPDWQQLCKTIKSALSLTTLVLTSWRMGLWIARTIVEQQLEERAQVSMQWECCSTCGRRLVSKGFVKRQMLTLVGAVEGKRRVGRCPHKCSGSQQIPFDVALGIQPYQQTSTELMRLGCLRQCFYHLTLPLTCCCNLRESPLAMPQFGIGYKRLDNEP